MRSAQREGEKVVPRALSTVVNTLKGGRGGREGGGEREGEEGREGVIEIQKQGRGKMDRKERNLTVGTYHNVPTCTCTCTCTCM